MIMDFRRLELLVNFRCFDLTGNDDTAQTHQNVIDMFFHYYIYIIYFILLLIAWKMFEILFIWFCFIKVANFSRRSALKAGTQLRIKMADHVFSLVISQPKYYGFVRYILKWWGFAPIWFRIQLLCASCWRYEIALLIYCGTNCLLELRYTWHFDVHISILWRFTVLAFSDKTFSSTPL